MDRNNLEAVFLAATVMATFAAYATAKVASHGAAAPMAASAVAMDQPMPVVLIKGARLTAAEKAAL